MRYLNSQNTIYQDKAFCKSKYIKIKHFVNYLMILFYIYYNIIYYNIFYYNIFLQLL